MDEPPCVDKAAVMTITDFPGVNPAGLDIIAEACRSHPDRLFGFIRLNPAREESQELLTRGATELGFKGLKLHPVSSLQHPGGTATIELIRYAREPAPTSFHCGDEPIDSPVNRAGRGRLSRLGHHPWPHGRLLPCRRGARGSGQVPERHA